MSVHWLVSWSVGWSVYHDILKGREVTHPCSYRSPCITTSFFFRVQPTSKKTGNARNVLKSSKPALFRGEMLVGLVITEMFIQRKARQTKLNILFAPI